MQIPTSFRISGKTYTVRVTDSFDSRYIGCINYTLGAITIALRHPRSKRMLAKDDVANTFWHELTHAVLKDMGSPLWCNERFVTAFADRLTEAVRTAKL